MTTLAASSLSNSLTEEQAIAVTSRASRLYIEAAPGSGKTTVAAHRFAVQRFERARVPDARAVVAVSFTRAATWELSRRIRRHWGHGAIKRPHRVVTLDALISDLLTSLLRGNHLQWPGVHVDLDVRDTWKSLVAPGFTNRGVRMALMGTRVVVLPRIYEKAFSQPRAAGVTTCINVGICTHEDVRDVLALALQQPAVRRIAVERMRATTRALIVDEVFDANELDLEIVRLAADAAAAVTLIGDPWQALYRFRGARPDLVPALTAALEAETAHLTTSFRWQSEAQARLASDLRASKAVTLTRGDASDALDVVLAAEWKHLWELNTSVLPLAFGAAKWNIPEAGATLLLDYVTRAVLALPAVYRDDALATLGIDNPDATTRLDELWPGVLEGLRRPGKPGLVAAYEGIVTAIGTESSAEFPAVRGNYTKRLGWLRDRIVQPLDPIAGLTVHQAKGREWERVGVAFSDDHHGHLSEGLSHHVTAHRLIYVACTRARDSTVAV